MVRIIDQETRRRQVLAAVIDNYIKTASAVSSEEICRAFECSSATIRNIMAELEEQGYLAHMHTSSGRVPTDKGYRYYIDVIASEIELVTHEKERITSEYNHQINKLEDIMERASEVLSNFTRCAGIISSINLGNKIYYNGTSFITEYPELKNIERIRGILKLLEEKNTLLDIINRDLEKKLNVYIGWETACRDISDCSLVVSTYGIEGRPYGRIAVLGPRSMNYSRVIPTLEYVSELVGKALENL